LLLVRRDPDGVTRQYAHLGTGNYNATTARIYTDLSLLTADPEITSAVHDVFSFLTAYAEHPSYGPLLVAPLDLAEKCMRLIEREAEHARMGRPARIIAKMNALLDVNIIQALYRASQAGVDIELLVRGMCASAARGSRPQRSHPRAQHRGPVSRAQPHLLLRERRRA
jgi:polyphosphate kinase